MSSQTHALRPDLKKVRDAVAKLGTNTRTRSHDRRRDPVDAGIRTIMKKSGDTCSGFYCRDFLHGH